MGTNLIVHHRVTNIFSQTGQCLGILDVVEETRDFTPLLQRFQIPKNLVQFPGHPVSGLDLNVDKK